MITTLKPLPGTARLPSDRLRRWEKRLALAFFRMVERVRHQVKVEELARSLERSFGDAWAYLDLEKRFMDVAYGVGVPVMEDSFSEVFDEIFESGARSALEELARVPVRKQEQEETVGARLAFDLRNPRAIEFLRRYKFELIRELSAESREAIRDVILQAFERGGHPVEQARLIRDVIGLTKRQAQAVANYHRLLGGTGAELRPALERRLRDRRFDPTLMRTIAEGGFLDPDRIEAMTERYYRRMLQFRAETIARTETIRANAHGRQECWMQAVDQGLLDPKTARRIWIVSGDEATCEVCQEVPTLNPDGVALDAPFETASGPIDVPPLHPRCRCQIALEFRA